LEVTGGAARASAWVRVAAAEEGGALSGACVPVACQYGRREERVCEGKDLYQRPPKAQVPLLLSDMMGGWR
jgi:hypothetical protein